MRDEDIPFWNWFWAPVIDWLNGGHWDDVPGCLEAWRP